jgi:hypothetical protein
MCYRICLCAVVASLLSCIAQAQPASSPYPNPSRPHDTFLVSQQTDDLEPEPLSAEQRETEKEVYTKLRGFKDAAGKAKCFVIVERFGEADRCVTSVTFMGGKIDDEMLKLTARLARISTINADKCEITDDQLKQIADLKSLTTLVLSNTPITGKGFAQLHGLDKLQALHLSNSKVSDAALDDIAQIKHLKILNLSQTKVTDRGVKRLLPLTELNWLLLSETAITDAGLRPLAGMKKLGRLTILKTKVTPEGVERLKTALPKLHVDQ